MPVYYLSNTTSDLAGGADFNKYLESFTETSNTITVEVANEATETSYAFSRQSIPNNDDWETGTMTVEVNVTTADANIFLNMTVSRILALGTVQETSTAAGEQQLSATGVYTFTIPSTNWTAGNCSDRYRFNYAFRSANQHGGAASVEIETGTTDTEHTTVITRGNANCLFIPTIKAI